MQKAATIRERDHRNIEQSPDQQVLNLPEIDHEISLLHIVKEKSLLLNAWI